MTKAAYSYTINQDRKVVSIIDKNGMRSVTNEIENVIEEICDKESIAPGEYGWVYKDSSGEWDAFDPVMGIFALIGEDSEEAAVNLIALRRENNSSSGFTCCGGGCSCG